MNRLTRQKAIDAKCKGCAYDECDAGTWRKQVELCGGVYCGLYDYRPVSRKTEKALRAGLLSDSNPKAAAPPCPDSGLRQMTMQDFNVWTNTLAWNYLRPSFTRQQAIEAECRSCVYHPKNGGTPREQIEACPDGDCPLYEYRPVSRATEKSRRQERYSAMTPEEVARRRARATSLTASVHKRKNDQQSDSGGDAS